MKAVKQSFFTSGIVALFLYGCVAIPAPDILPTAQKCSTPLANLQVNSITTLRNDLAINADFIKSLLNKASNEGCFTLDKTATNSYNAQITYETTFQSDQEQKIATSNSQTSLNAQVQISLKNANSSKKFNGKSSVQISSKKILDIGMDTQIKQTDKDQVITEAFKAAYDSAVQNFK